MVLFNKQKVLKMEHLLEKITNDTHETKIGVKFTDENIKINSKMEGKQIISVPRGKPKSGRIWKNEKTRFSSIIKTKGIRVKFERKEALRNELKRVKEASKAIVVANKEQKEVQKKRRRDNLKRQEENRKKSEVVQVIKNPSKIKRMKKKQLRYIEKRDINM